eukprot:UN00766
MLWKSSRNEFENVTHAQDVLMEMRKSGIQNPNFFENSMFLTFFKLQKIQNLS